MRGLDDGLSPRSSFLSSQYLCFLLLMHCDTPTCIWRAFFLFLLKEIKKDYECFSYSYLTHKIFCKSKWHILKMYMLSAECVHAFFWLFFPCNFYLLVVNLGKKGFCFVSARVILSSHISVAVKSFGNRSWAFWAEYLIWQYQYDSNNPLLVSVIKGKHSCKSVFFNTALFQETIVK